ncbi:MAG: hypothetical protein Q8O33_00050 [Pseudomonadota bacterium]|nr:hypothetical protein [Pseudomonadota bacterium]
MSQPARFASPSSFLVRYRVWIAAGLGILALIGLSIWGALAAIGWMWGQTQGWSQNASEAARGALQQVEQVVPDARETLGELVPVLKPAKPVRRDVSGTDIGPVARYPGLARTYWHREGKQIAVEYEGDAEFATVLDHYVQGFAARGFTQTVQSATQTAETHDYTNAREHLTLSITEKPKGGISVRIKTHTQ